MIQVRLVVDVNAIVISGASTAGASKNSPRRGRQRSVDAIGGRIIRSSAYAIVRSDVLVEAVPFGRAAGQVRASALNSSQVRNQFRIAAMLVGLRVQIHVSTGKGARLEMLPGVPAVHR